MDVTKIQITTDGQEIVTGMQSIQAIMENSNKV